MNSRSVVLQQLYELLIREMVKEESARFDESSPETFDSKDYVFEVVVSKKRRLRLVDSEEDG